MLNVIILGIQECDICAVTVCLYTS